jgi:RNA polymerase sigma-70 factor, ECF subfamily
MPLIDAADANMEMRPIEPEDFDWIVRQYQKQIFRLCLLLVRDSDAAENLTQECFLRAFRNRQSFRGESRLGTWLIRIAINLAHDHNKNRRWIFWRRRNRTDQIDFLQMPDIRCSAEQALIDRELVNGIQSAITHLPERQKTVFLLRFVEDMPLEKIAETMSLEIGTVKTHLSRALGKVRRACSKKR